MPRLMRAVNEGLTRIINEGSQIYDISHEHPTRFICFMVGWLMRRSRFMQTPWGSIWTRWYV